MVRNIYFDTWDNIKRYARFEKGEQRGFWLSILVVAFIISFNDWGAGAKPEIGVGAINFLGAIIVVALSFFGRTWAQKCTGAGTGYRAEFKPWTPGLLFALFLAFVTSGKFWFLIPGGIVVHFMEGGRLGMSKYMLSPFGVGTTSIAGPIGNIFVAMVFRVLHSVTQVDLFYTAFLFNIIWALWTLSPIPPSDGSRMFFGSRIAYMWCVGLVVGGAALLYSKVNIFLSIILMFVFAWVWWLIYYLVWERYNWKGNY